LTRQQFFCVLISPLIGLLWCRRVYVVTGVGPMYTSGDPREGFAVVSLYVLGPLSDWRKTRDTDTVVHGRSRKEMVDRAVQGTKDFDDVVDAGGLRRWV
jgi:hypothetical protein